MENSMTMDDLWYPYFRKPPDVVCCNNIHSEQLSSTGLICPKKMDISDGKDG